MMTRLDCFSDLNFFSCSISSRSYFAGLYWGNRKNWSWWMEKSNQICSRLYAISTVPSFGWLCLLHIFRIRGDRQSRIAYRPVESPFSTQALRNCSLQAMYVAQMMSEGTCAFHLRITQRLSADYRWWTVIVTVVFYMIHKQRVLCP